MNKLKYILIFLLSIFFTQTMALSGDIQHFKTTDGKHMCSLASESNFKPCVLFGIKYQNDIVTFGQKPSLETGRGNYAVVKNTSGDMCVHNGLEVDVTNCKMLQSGTFSRDNLIQTGSTTSITQSGVDGIKTKYVDNSKEIQQKLDSVNELLKQVGKTEITNSGKVQTGITEITNSGKVQTGTTQSLNSTSSLNSNQIMSETNSGNTIAGNQEISSGSELEDTTQNINTGSEVSDKSENNTMLNLIAGAGLFYVVFIVIIGILSIIFYFINLIHAIINPVPNKALWIIGMILIGILYIPYYFIVKRPFDKEKKFGKNNNFNQAYPNQTQAIIQPTTQINDNQEKSLDFDFEIKQ